MSASPKIVKINLQQQSKKHQTSPSKKTTKQRLTELQQFSFSEDHKISPSPHKSPPKSKPPSPLVKKLFNSSPYKPKQQQTRKSSPESVKDSIDKIREKYRKMNPNYEKVDQNDKFFKRSIEKLKRSFFKNDKNSKQTTKKILKEIGKYAQNRSKNKPIKQLSNSKVQNQKQQTIPIEFYGFKESPKLKPTRKERQQVQKGTYLNFERAYQLSIGSNNKQMNNIDYKNDNVHYVDKQSARRQHFFQDHDEFEPVEKDPIGQKQIDIVCQIFQYCDKCSQDDIITIEDLNKLIEQLQRLYFINIAQNSQQKPQKQQLKPQILFYNLLKELQEDLRVIFYRKHENNVYDALYYLKQTNHLQLVCEDFLKIKNILQL